MTVLVLDAGNSRVKAALLDPAVHRPAHPAAGGPARAAPVPWAGERATPAGGTEDADLAAWLEALRGRAGGPAVLVSVVPHVTSQMRALGGEVSVVDHTCDLPFASRVPDMAAVGPDRLANVAAACGAGLRDALVVDAGTATTCDVLVDGVFLGGVIAPGMALAADALAARAARLGAVPLAEAPLEAARDTAGAMAAGAWHAGRGGVRALVDGLRRRHGNLPVVVTGGLGGHLADMGWHDPAWTVRGALWLAVRPDTASGC